MTHTERIASQLNVKPSQVTAVIKLLDEGNTVPFIARHRKEMAGSLDEERIRIIADELIRRHAVGECRTAILATIEELGTADREDQQYQEGYVDIMLILIQFICNPLPE